jgi:hypothetical protein
MVGAIVTEGVTLIAAGVATTGVSTLVSQALNIIEVSRASTASAATGTRLIITVFPPCRGLKKIVTIVTSFKSLSNLAVIEKAALIIIAIRWLLLTLPVLAIGLAYGKIAFHCEFFICPLK